MRPRPPWGQGWRKGGYHHDEKRISPEQIYPKGVKRSPAFQGIFLHFCGKENMVKIHGK